MNKEFSDLYQEIILDHNRSPRNYHRMENPTHVLEGVNALCGDHYTIYLKLKDDIIEDVSFEGSGCAISKASASVMSTLIKGKSIEEADHFFELFHKIVRGEMGTESFPDETGKLAIFSGISEFPMRVKCATLPWHTMYTAIHGTKKKKVSSEETN